MRLLLPFWKLFFQGCSPQTIFLSVTWEMCFVLHLKWSFLKIEDFGCLTSFSQHLNVSLHSITHEFWAVRCNFCFAPVYYVLAMTPFRIFIFVFDFLHLNIMCLGIIVLAFVLFGVLWASWICCLVSDIDFGKSRSLFFQIFPPCFNSLNPIAQKSERGRQW